MSFSIFENGRKACATFVCLALTAIPTFAQDSGSGVAPGVNPKDNITKTEVIFNHASFDGGVDVATFALKFDYAFSSSWGGNIEIPVSRFSAPGIGKTGVGDIALRVRNVQTFGRTSILSAVEIVTPTAADDLLGTGRLQFNPVIGGVYAFSDMNFGFLGYKHYFSVGGDDTRPEINRSEIRGLMAWLSPKGRWALLDAKYSKSHTGTQDETLDFEVELGTMLSSSVALSGRLGTSFLDSTRDVGFSVNLRKIW